ncbi:MAG: glycosyl transferase family 1, partial [Phycisphaerae bacterium]
MPQIDLRHMLVMTDGTAMLQHAKCATPNLHHGYCTDDNARALIAGVLYLDLHPETHEGDFPIEQAPGYVIVAMQRYLAFLWYAFNPEEGRFRNFMHFDRTWLERVGSPDSHARALWGLSIAATMPALEDIRQLADNLFLQALPAVRGFRYIHSQCYSLLGLHEYISGGGMDSDEPREVERKLAETVLDRWKKNADDDWPWWNDCLTWGNPKLPHGMLVAGKDLGNNEMMDAALKSLRWLAEIQTDDRGCLSVVGNAGWFPKKGVCARYDQQPIEVQGMVQACLAAAKITGDAYWTDQAVRCFEWFRGRNINDAIMINEN